MRFMHNGRLWWVRADGGWIKLFLFFRFNLLIGGCCEAMLILVNPAIDVVVLGFTKELFVVGHRWLCYCRRELDRLRGLMSQTSWIGGGLLLERRPQLVLICRVGRACVGLRWIGHWLVLRMDRDIHFRKETLIGLVFRTAQGVIELTLIINVHTIESFRGSFLEVCFIVIWGEVLRCMAFDCLLWNFLLWR